MCSKAASSAGNTYAASQALCACVFSLLQRICAWKCKKRKTFPGTSALSTINFIPGHRIGRYVFRPRKSHIPTPVMIDVSTRAGRCACGAKRKAQSAACTPQGSPLALSLITYLALIQPVRS